MIASMHARVTIQTGTIKGLVVQYTINRLVRLVCTPRIKFARMTLVGVAPLTEIGCLAIQKRDMRRSVRGMACETVFYRRRMFPQKRSPHFGMTFQAFQVDVLGIDELIRNGPVGIMAIPALDLPFPYWMAGSPKQLGPYRFVTLETHLDLSRF